MMQESVYCKLVQNAGVADVVQRVSGRINREKDWCKY